MSNRGVPFFVLGGQDCGLSRWKSRCFHQAGRTGKRYTILGPILLPFWTLILTHSHTVTGVGYGRWINTGYIPGYISD